MSQGKRKHHYTRTLRIAHLDAVSSGNCVLRVPQIVKNPIKSTDISSDTLWGEANFGLGITTTTVKGPKTYYARESGFDPNTRLGNTENRISTFPTTNFKLGADSYMDLDKVRIITKIKVICISNVNSEIINPPVELSTSEVVQPQSGSYREHIDAFRLNPGGYQGFNIYKIDNATWNRRVSTNFNYLYNFESLFKSGETHHSELPYEADNLSWVLKKQDDLILWPTFKFFNSANAAFVVEPSHRQALSVKLPYYEYIVDMNYFDI